MQSQTRLDTCIGFIDVTVLGISRSKGHLAQRVVYNGHKRKHAMKYQAVNTLNGMIQHVHGPCTSGASLMNYYRVFWK